LVILVGWVGKIAYSKNGRLLSTNVHDLIEAKKEENLVSISWPAVGFFYPNHHFPQYLNKTLVGIIFSASLCLLVNTRVQSQEGGKESFYSQLNRAIIRLEHSTQDTTIAVGTAFFVHTGKKLFVVTARHVAEKNYDMQARVPTKHDSTGQIELFNYGFPAIGGFFIPNRVTALYPFCGCCSDEIGLDDKKP